MTVTGLLVTLRGRIGAEASERLLIEGDGTLALDQDYFGGVDRMTSRPLAGHSENIELNRARRGRTSFAGEANVGELRVLGECMLRSNQVGTRK